MLKLINIDRARTRWIFDSRPWKMPVILFCCNYSVGISGIWFALCNGLIVNWRLDQIMIMINSCTKGGVVSEGIFKLVPFSKEWTNSLSLNFKSWVWVIWFIFWRKGPNKKYYLILSHIYNQPMQSRSTQFIRGGGALIRGQGGAGFVNEISVHSPHHPLEFLKSQGPVFEQTLSHPWHDAYDDVFSCV